MDDDEETTGYSAWEEERRARYDAARDRLSAALTELMAVTAEDDFPDSPPFVQGWIAVAEWTNVELERKNRAGRHVVTPHGQMLSINIGLADWAAAVDV